MVPMDDERGRGGSTTTSATTRRLGAVAFGLAVVATLVIAGASLGLGRGDTGATARQPVEPRTCVGAEVMLPAPSRSCVLPDADVAYEPPLDEGDVRGPGAPVGYEPGDLESVMTRFGSGGATTRVLVVGDSHVRHWVSVLLPYTAPGTEGRVNVTSIYYGGCSLSRLAPAFTLGGAPDVPRIELCERWKDDTRAYLADHAGEYDLVIAGGSAYNQPHDDYSRAELRDAVVREWTPVSAQTQVAFVRDTPRWPDDPRECLREAGDAGRDPRTCAIDLDVGMRWPDADPFVDAGSAMRVPVLDMTDLLCSESTERCYAVAGGVRVMRDESHVTEEYLASAAPVLWARMRAFDLV